MVCLRAKMEWGVAGGRKNIGRSWNVHLINSSYSFPGTLQNNKQAGSPHLGGDNGHCLFQFFLFTNLYCPLPRSLCMAHYIGLASTAPPIHFKLIIHKPSDYFLIQLIPTPIVARLDLGYDGLSRPPLYHRHHPSLPPDSPIQYN